MKAKEVLEKLNITRPTLTKYVKQGLVKVDAVINGQYHYNEESVEALLNNKITEASQDNSSNQDQVKSITVEDTPIQLNHEKDIVTCLYNIYLILNQLGHLRLFTSNSAESLAKIKEVLNTLKNIK